MKLQDYKLAIRLALTKSVVLSWPLTWQVISIFAGSAAGRLVIRRSLDKKRRHVVNRFHELTLKACHSQQKSKKETKEELRKIYVNEVLLKYLYIRFHHLGEKGVKAWIRVFGEDNLTRCLQEKNPLILLGSHYGASRIFPYWLGLQGIKFYSIEMTNLYRLFRLQQPESLAIGQVGEEFSARLAVQADRILHSGGIVHITGDNQRSGSQRSETFQWEGIDFTMSATFAIMAAKNKATVLPYFCRFDRTGRPLIEFCSPLRVASNTKASKELGQYELIQELLILYIAAWKKHAIASPGNIRVPWL